MKPGELDLNEPIIMVWRDRRVKSRPWRFAIWYHETWFNFSNIPFMSKAYAAEIAQKTLSAMQEKATFKPL